MRIVAWNCQMGFHKKVEPFMSLSPDLAVISECSQGSAQALQSHGYESLWFGSNRHKGLAVLCRTDWAIEPIHAPEQKWVVPIRVNTEASVFTLIAVWACRAGSTKADQYIGQVYKALSAHPEWLCNGPVVVAGDLNSNQIWDAERSIGNHSAVVRLLEQMEVVSCYHRYFGETHGNESRPTIYLYRHKSKPFHIDYIFIPEKWVSKLRTVDVGDFATWSRHSDHSPVIVDIAD